jgi:hypothetical protein
MPAPKIFKLTARSFLFCMATVSATASFSQSPQGSDTVPDLYGVSLNGARITIDVVSYGMTVASDFSVQLDSTSPDTYRLTIIRHKQDRGRVSPHIVGLTIELPTIQHLAQAKFLVINKLATTGDPSDPHALLRSSP